MKVGVLALQGAFALHAQTLDELGANAILVRAPSELCDVDALVLPGGESTTMSMLLESSGLVEPLVERIDAGLPVLGTCAGMILLSREIVDGRPDQRCFAAIDLAVRRNGFGRQRDSFEADLDIAGVDGPSFRGVFIRAPVVERVGPGVEILASAGGDPVLCRQGATMVASFHPELTQDPRVHELFLTSIETAPVS